MRVKVVVIERIGSAAAVVGATAYGTTSADSQGARSLSELPQLHTYKALTHLAVHSPALSQLSYMCVRMPDWNTKTDALNVVNGQCNMTTDDTND